MGYMRQLLSVSLSLDGAFIATTFAVTHTWKITRIINVHQRKQKAALLGRFIISARITYPLPVDCFPFRRRMGCQSCLARCLV